MMRHMNSTITKTLAFLAIACMAFAALAQAANKPAAFYCKYCGHKASSVASLTAGACLRHPDGPHKGRHALYEGSEKKSYTCKYCGTKAASIASLTAGACLRHPNGPHKGKHAPAL